MEKSLTGEDHAVLSHPHDHPQEPMFEGNVLSSRTLLLRQKRKLLVNGKVNFRHSDMNAISLYPPPLQWQ